METKELQLCAIRGAFSKRRS